MAQETVALDLPREFNHINGEQPFDGRFWRDVGEDRLRKLGSAFSSVKACMCLPLESDDGGLRLKNPTFVRERTITAT